MEFLKVENLCKYYGTDENKVIALDNVSLTIEKGDFHSYLVPNILIPITESVFSS